MFKRGPTGSTWSGNQFKVDQDKFFESEYNPLLGECGSEEEWGNPSTPRGAVQTIDQCTSGTKHSTTPPPPLPPPHTPTPPPPPPPPPMLFSMTNIVNMPIFRGQGWEDPEQFWFSVEAVKITTNQWWWYEESATSYNATGNGAYLVYQIQHNAPASLANTKDAVNA